MKTMYRSKWKGLFSHAILIILLFFLSLNSRASSEGKRDYYELKIYHMSQKSQEARVDAYLKDVFIPALHRAGVKSVGVFKPVEADTAYGKLIYVFIPFKYIDEFTKLPDLLLKDKVYPEASKSFTDAPFNDPPYTREECILLKAFKNMPHFEIPAYSTSPAERIFELRSYESATEAKAIKKIEMFNDGGEISLFASLKFNAVFFGEVLSGSHMPNLIYMTSFSDMKAHDEHWKEFGSSSEWKRLSGLEEFKNTVSKANPYLLHPASYSDF